MQKCNRNILISEL